MTRPTAGPRSDDPGHPTALAIALMACVFVLIVVLAIAGSL